MVSLRALRLRNPDKVLFKTPESLGLRIGVDKIPRSMLNKKQVTIPRLIKKGPIEPYWHRATTPQPFVELRDKPFHETPLGKFMKLEWVRFRQSEEGEKYKYNGLPRGTISNPFLPAFNPVTRTFRSPIYNSEQQKELVQEARRLGWTDVLPSGKKTPEGFANESIMAWGKKGPYGEKERVDLGRITWFGKYEKKLNPNGAGRFSPERMAEQQQAPRKMPGTDVDVWGPYAGREDLFQGTLNERNKPKRQAETAARMASMAKRIATWKQDQLAAKVKARPALPF